MRAVLSGPATMTGARRDVGMRSRRTESRARRQWDDRQPAVLTGGREVRRAAATRMAMQRGVWAWAGFWERDWRFGLTCDGFRARQGRPRDWTHARIKMNQRQPVARGLDWTSNTRV
jgi:hypothetical protein